MATKTHPNWKRAGKGINKRWEKIAQKDCPACIKRCVGCNQPFVLSTADDERFCSKRCEQRY